MTWAKPVKPSSGCQVLVLVAIGLFFLPLSTKIVKKTYAKSNNTVLNFVVNPYFCVRSTKIPTKDDPRNPEITNQNVIKPIVWLTLSCGFSHKDGAIIWFPRAKNEKNTPAIHPPLTTNNSQFQFFNKLKKRLSKLNLDISGIIAGK